MDKKEMKGGKKAKKQQKNPVQKNQMVFYRNEKVRKFPIISI